MLRRIGVLFGSALLVAGVIGVDPGAVAAPAAPSREIVVTRSSASLPPGCTPRRLATFVEQFFEAFNGEEWGKVDALFAPTGPQPDDFKLFSWERDVVQERERLVPYLGALRARGERLRVLVLLARKEPRVASSVEITYAFEGSRGVGIGKGLIDCTSQKIWQWAMSPQPGRVVLPCPQPAGWSTSGPIVACTNGPNARALAPGFQSGSTSIALPKPCRPTAVKRRVVAALAAFNLGRGDAFALQFVPRAEFHPYTVSIAGAGFLGRARIARFVPARYRAGDGWTAVGLLPPQGSFGLPDSAVFGLALRVTHQGALVAMQAGAKLVVDCRSGLLERWVGPALKTPG